MFDTLMDATRQNNALCVTFDWNADQTRAHVIVWSLGEAIIAQGELDVTNADKLDDETVLNIKIHNTNQETNYWTGHRVA